MLDHWAIRPSTVCGVEASLSFPPSFFRARGEVWLYDAVVVVVTFCFVCGKKRPRLILYADEPWRRERPARSESGLGECSGEVRGEVGCA